MVSVAATLSRRKPMTGRKLRLMTLSTSLLALPLRYGYVLRQPNDARGAPLTGLLIKPSLDDPCRALCIIDRAPKPRAALRERCNSPRSLFRTQHLEPGNLISCSIVSITEVLDLPIFENVQGDERDVIFIGTVYGSEE